MFLSHFLIQWNGYVSKPDKFESHNSLKLSFTNIRCLRSNFVGCESSLQPDSPDILALCERNLNESMVSSNFSVRRYFSLIGKDSITHIMAIKFMWRKDILLHVASPWKILKILTYVFNWLYFISVFLLFFTDHCLRLYARFFMTVSSNIDKVLFIKPCATTFIFGDFNIHHKGWLTYSGGTSEVLYNISVSNSLTQIVNCPTQILTVILTACSFGFMSIFWC